MKSKLPEIIRDVAVLGGTLPSLLALHLHGLPLPGSLPAPLDRQGLASSGSLTATAARHAATIGRSIRSREL